MFTPRVGALLSALALTMSATAIPASIVPTSAALPTVTSTDAASSVHPNVFDVYDPPITSPTQGAVWTAGSQQTVTWDASKVGDDAKNSTAMLLLGHQEPGDLSEYLDLKHPLAKDFSIDAGSASFTVPDVMTAKNYIVVLVGSASDSGNASPQFTIQNDARPDLFSWLSPSPSATSAPISSVVSAASATASAVVSSAISSAI